MKKIFLTAIALITMATQVFGMYGVDSGDWIGFLTHGNQFRARLNQLGFTLGNDTIKGTFGFHSGANGIVGTFAQENKNTTAPGDQSGQPTLKTYYDFLPTISMGLAYTSPLISVGVGYNATIGTNKWQKYNGKDDAKTKDAVVHTPVLVLNALDNAFRMAVPIQILHISDKMPNDGGKHSMTAVSLEAQFRYYTGLEIVPQIRLLLKYGTYKYATDYTGQEKDKGTLAESFGFQFRLYFGTTVEDVSVQPFIRIDYDTALGKQHNQTKVVATEILGRKNWLSDASAANGPSDWERAWAKPAWELKILPSLGLAANSDLVEFYLEPSLGFKVTQDGSATDKNIKDVFGLAYGVYAEIYVRPVKTLEWYFEAELGNIAENSKAPSGTINAGIGKGLGFNASTGITWYLPQL